MNLGLPEEKDGCYKSALAAQLATARLIRGRASRSCSHMLSMRRAVVEAFETSGVAYISELGRPS